MLSLSCKKPLLYLGALLASLALLSTSANARDLYWNSQGQILASDIDGQNVEVLFDGSESSPPMEGDIVDVLSTDDHIYWTGHSGGDIWRANRDGSDATQFIPDAGANIHFLAIDEARQKIYYSDYSAGLYEANLDDGGDITSFWWDTTPGALAGLAMRGSEVLWISAGSNFLYETDPTFPNSADFTEMEGGDATYGLAYDPDTETAYYTNFEENTLRSYNFATEEHELLNTPGMTSPLDVALSPSGTHLLIAERGRGVTGYEIGTGGYELLADDSEAHFGVAATADPGTLEVPQPAEDGDVLFSADFEEDTLNEAPVSGWDPIDGPDTGTAEVVVDDEDVFGFGSENQFFRVESANGMNLTTPTFSSPAEVLTLSFDFIGRFLEADENRWLNVHLQAGGARTHITSLRMADHTIRSETNPSYGGNDIPLRMETIMNNSPDTITYENPFGDMEDLPSGQATLWVYDYGAQTWDQLEESYVFAENFTDRGAYMDGIWFQLDGNEPLRSFDLDNVKATMGAHLSDLQGEPVPPPPFLGHWELDFEGIPTGEITRDDADQFIHGNLTGLSFHSEYDLEGATRPALLIGLDEDDQFGGGTDNQILQTNEARGWTFTGENNFNEEVLTLRMDMIHHGVLTGEDVTSQVIIRHFDENDVRLSQVALRAEDSPGTILGQDDAGWELDAVNRFELVLNNTEDALTYTSPDGLERTVDAGASDMWINGEFAFGNHTHGRNGSATPGPIMDLEIKTNSNNIWDADFDLIQTYPGVELVPVDDQTVSPYRLETAWELAPGDRDYLTESAEQRGLAFNPDTGHLIVPDRGTDDRPMTIAIVDAATGDDVGTLSTSGISGGTFAINHVAAASDGAIYGANLSTDTMSDPLKVYRWADESSDPVVVYEGDPSDGDTGNSERELRFGDTMTLRGSGTDTQILMAPRFGVNPVIFTPDGSMQTFVATRLITDIPTDDPAGLLTHGLAFGEGDTFFAKRQPQFGSEETLRALVEVGFDLGAGTGELLSTYDETVFPNDIGLLGTDLEKGLLVGVDSDAVNQDEEELRRPANVMLFDLASLTDATVNLALDSEEFGPSNWNGNGSGQVVFGDNDMVYVLDTSNGIGAFNVVEEASGETFASWQETHFPGETDPSIIGPDANPSGDGVPNLLKYALGLDPTEASRDGVPASGVQEFTVGEETDEYLTLTFTKPDSVEDVGFSVKASSDLVSWPDEAVLEESSSNGDGTTTFTYRDSAPLGSADRRFINLEVTILD